MYRSIFLVVAFAVVMSSKVQAQIFINTGNPNLEKYKKEDPNAVIWDGGANVPIPPNIPAEPKHEPVKHQPGTPASSTPNSYSTTQQKRDVKPNYSEPAVKQDNTPTYSQQTASTATRNAVPDYPPNAVPGKCYAHCIVPDQYEFKEEQVVEKPASFTVEKVPARYETVYETVVIVPEGRRTISIPAQYETVTEDKMVSPATQKWVKVPGGKTCLSPNPKDCEIWVLKDIPAVYEKVARKVEVVPSSSREEIIPAVTKVMPRKKIVEPAREVRTDLPPTYKMITKKILVKRGSGYEWKEIICEQNLTESKIFALQQALAREGYDPGSVDNQMGDKTKEALIKFQQDKGLTVGSLTIETLKALGVE